MIPVVLAVDLEPDGPGECPPTGVRWDGVAATAEALDGLRPRWQEATGHAPVVTWFPRFDPQVEAVNGSAAHVVEAHADVFAAIARRDEPVGLHVHAWRRDGEGWVDDYGDPEWLRSCIDRSFAAYEDVFGRPCRLTRLGGRFLDDASARHLAARGVAVDLSLEPANHGLSSGTRSTIRGDLPDCRRTPRRPHAVAAGLVELPLSATSRPKGWHPRPHLSRVRHHGWHGRLDLPMQLGRRPRPGDTFRAMVERTLRGQRRPYLAYAIRSDSLLAGEKRDRVLGQLDDVMAVLAERGGAVVGPETALARLAGR